MDVTIRPAAEADRPAVELLCVAALEFDARRDSRAFPTVLARRDTIQLVAEATDEIVGTAYGSIKGEVGHVDLVAVAPGNQRQGIGKRLLASLETALKEAGCAEIVVRGNPPWYTWPGVDVRYTPAICMFEGAGYAKFGEAHNMALDLFGKGEMLDTTSDEERLAEEGIVVRRLKPADEEPIRPWLDTWQGTWRDEVLTALRFDPVRAHVAHRGETWLGFAAWGVNAPTVFGPMGTANEARNLGIGSVLLRRCLADQYVEEIDRAEIGWAGPYRFYSRTVEARISRVFWFFKKSLVPA